MANPDTRSSRMHLSPQTEGSRSRTPSTDSRSKRSAVRGFFGNFRSKSPGPTAVNDECTETHALASAYGTSKVSRSSLNVSISTANTGLSNAHAATSSITAPATGTIVLSTLSPDSPPGDVSTAPTFASGIRISVSAASSVSKGAETWSFRSNIFPKNNIARINIDVPAPNIGQDFEDTAQLAICASLLNMVVEEASSSSSSPPAVSLTSSATFSSLSVSQQSWISEIEKSLGEKHHLDQIKTRMVNEFVSRDVKDSEAIREIILLGSVLNSELYSELFDCFLKLLDSSVLLKVNVLLGLVQLIQDAPKNYLTPDDLNRTLNCLKRRFDSSQIGKNELAYLVLAITMVLILLVPCQITGLSREKEHEPLLEILLELRKHDDPLVRYQADYACQSLLSVSDDETRRQKYIRHFLGLSNGLLKMTGVVQYDFSGIAEGLPNVIKGTRGLFGLLKTTLGFGGEARWFKAVQEAEDHASRGDFSSLNIMMCDPQNSQDIKFLWGISRLVGEVAADPSWDLVTREQAVEFLGEMFKTSVDSKQDKDVMRWILMILGHLSNMSASASSDGINPALLMANSPIKAKARDLINHLNRSGDDEFKYIHPLRISMPLPKSSLLLKEANKNPGLDHLLHNLQHKRLGIYSKYAGIYIQPMCKPNLQASDDDHVPLHARVHDFLEGTAKVMLILGDSGAGKSTFSERFEYKLWTSYKQGDPIPLFINLPGIDRPDIDLIAKQLRIHKFSEAHIQELKQHRRLVLICDGYDETQEKVNLHTANQLNEEGQPITKMIVSCRSTVIGHNHSDLFSPQASNRYRASKIDQYAEAVIIPFSTAQIEDYVCQFVRDSEVHKLADNRLVWSIEDYMDKLKSIPNLIELVKNPFLLSLALNALPKVVKGIADLNKVKVNRLTLYNSFIDDWLEKSRLRLRGRSLSGDLKDAFEVLLEDGFDECVLDFSMRLAAAIFHKHKGNPVILYKSRFDRGSWKEEFFSLKAETTLLRESSPLSRVEDQHRFMHRSFLEYFYSRHVHEMDENHDGDSGDITDSPLSKTDLVREPSIIQFLAEHVQADPGLERRLRQIIELSKTDCQASRAAANAVTILVRAGIRFNSADLSGIRIPGADLSYGQFDSAQLQGADLRNAALRHIWLRHADLSGAQMEGVEFGEWPYLQRDKMIRCGAYSPDGKALAVGLQDGDIAVYNTSTWVETIALIGHTKTATSVAYSPSGHQIASGSDDGSVRLWDAQTGAAGLVMTGHTDLVKSVAYSPSGHQIASVSHDRTVRLWDAQTGTAGLVLTGHTGYIISVTYSLRGDQIATGSSDNTVRLWDAQTGAASLVLTGHSRGVTSVVYSPSGHQIASGSYDNTVRLWEAQTGAASHTLTGHTGSIYSVAYSISGHQIATGSSDNTVRLWDAQTGAAGLIWTGHTGQVSSVLYSPSDHQIASVSSDNTVRLWDAQTAAADLVWTGHTDWVGSVAYSPSGHQIASGSGDRTVRLWDARRGVADHILNGHTAMIRSVAYSPSGHQIASVSDDRTVRLWNAQNGAAGLAWTGHTAVATSVAYSPSGHQIATGGGDGTVRLWDAQTGAASHVLTGHTDWILGVAFSPSGHQIASGSYDNTVRLWDAQTGAADFVLIGHTDLVRSVAYSPSGHQIASGSDDSAVRLWDAQTGAAGLVMTGHTALVSSVAYSPSGHQIATGSGDGTVRLWDTETGRCLVVVSDLPGAVSSVSWRSDDDGSYFVTGCENGAVCTWEVAEDVDDIQVRLHWHSAQSSLVLSRASIEDVHGLSEPNSRLLQQRGAVGATR